MNPSLDSCIDPPMTHDHLVTKRSYPGGRIVRRSTTTPGYTTSDDFGTDGDDTIHSKISYYSTPNFFQSNGSFPTNGTLDGDAKVDLVFVDYIAASVVAVLNSLGESHTIADVQYYMPQVSDRQAHLSNTRESS